MYATEQQFLLVLVVLDVCDRAASGETVVVFGAYWTEVLIFIGAANED